MIGKIVLLGFLASATASCTADEQCQDGQRCVALQFGCGETYEGECREVKPWCPRNYAPVCGCDGSTYSNQCTALVAGQRVASVGHCDTTVNQLQQRQATAETWGSGHTPPKGKGKDKDDDSESKDKDGNKGKDKGKGGKDGSKSGSNDKAPKTAPAKAPAHAPSKPAPKAPHAPKPPTIESLSDDHDDDDCEPDDGDDANSTSHSNDKDGHSGDASHSNDKDKHKDAKGKDGKSGSKSGSNDKDDKDAKTKVTTNGIAAEDANNGMKPSVPARKPSLLQSLASMVAMKFGAKRRAAEAATWGGSAGGGKGNGKGSDSSSQDKDGGKKSGDKDKGGKSGSGGKGGDGKSHSKGKGSKRKCPPSPKAPVPKAAPVTVPVPQAAPVPVPVPVAVPVPVPVPVAVPVPVGLPEGSECQAVSDCGEGLYCKYLLGVCGIFDPVLGPPTGTCTARPEVCEVIPVDDGMYVGKVCGCDRKTYTTLCHAAFEGLNVQSLGPCAGTEARLAETLGDTSLEGLVGDGAGAGAKA